MIDRAAQRGESSGLWLPMSSTTGSHDDPAKVHVRARKQVLAQDTPGYDRWSLALSVAGANHVVAQRIQHRELIGVEGDLDGGDILLEPLGPLRARDRREADAEPRRLAVDPRQGDLRGADALSLGDLRNSAAIAWLARPASPTKRGLWPRKSFSPNESGLTVPVRNPRPSGE